MYDHEYPGSLKYYNRLLQIIGPVQQGSHRCDHGTYLVIEAFIHFIKGVAWPVVVRMLFYPKIQIWDIFLIKGKVIRLIGPVMRTGFLAVVP